MKNVTRLLIPSLSLGFLVKSLVVGHALAFTLFVNPNDPTNPVPSRNYQIDGALTGPNSNPTLITPTNNNGAYTNRFLPTAEASYSTPSVVSFGVTQTTGPAGSDAVVNTAAFNGGPTSTVNYTFDLQNGIAPSGTFAPSGPFDRFVVTGSLLGSVGFPAPNTGNSTTRITFSSITNLDATGTQQVTSILTTNPNNGLAALFIKADVAGQDYSIYLNEVQDISAPGKSALSISGYVETSAVPEPGSLALLLGFGVTCTALLRRRRK